jgi:hypothetical protein
MNFVVVVVVMRMVYKHRMDHFPAKLTFALFEPFEEDHFAIEVDKCFFHPSFAYNKRLMAYLELIVRKRKTHELLNRVLDDEFLLVTVLKEDQTIFYPLIIDLFLFELGYYYFFDVPSVDLAWV